MRLFLLAAVVAAGLAPASAQTLGRAAIENFLRTARIVNSRELSSGVTRSQRARLTDGHLEHEAHVQIIDQSLPEFRSDKGSELNFKDCWRYNVAAYRLALLLGIDDMVPVSVERKVAGNSAAVTWWVDDVAMDESKRRKSATRPPADRHGSWNRQMHIVAVFDQLIYNTDRNLGNLLITTNWDVKMIDHTRAFRLHRNLVKPSTLRMCDRRLLQRMKSLDAACLQEAAGRHLTREEREALLSRRDRIVAYFETAGPGSLF